MQKVGYNSLVVTLPRDWVKKNAIKPQDIVLLSMSEDGSLIVRPEAVKKIGKGQRTITIDWQRSKGFSHAANALMKAYIHGNEIITLRKPKNSKWPDELWLALDCLPGVTILENTPTALVLQCSVEVPITGLNDLITMIQKIQHEVCGCICTSLSKSRIPDPEISNMISEAERQCSLLLRSIITTQTSGLQRYEVDLMILALTIRDLCSIMKSTLAGIKSIPDCDCSRQCAKIWQVVIDDIDDLFEMMRSRSDQNVHPSPVIWDPQKQVSDLKHLTKHSEKEAKDISLLFGSAYRCLSILHSARNWIQWMKSSMMQ